MASTQELKRLIQAAELGQTNDQKYVDRHIHEFLALQIKWVEAQDTAFQFQNASGMYIGGSSVAIAGASGARSFTVNVGVTASNNVQDPFSMSAMVTVSKDASSTATGILLNGGSSPVVLTMSNGSASLTASATSTGTIVLDLSAPSPSGLAVTQKLTITLS